MLQNILMLTLYILLNIYVIWRIGSWIDYAFSFHIKQNILLKLSIAIVCFTASSTIMLWLWFPYKPISILLIKIGNYWLGFFIEFVMCLLISDIIFIIIQYLLKIGRLDLKPLVHKMYGGLVLALALSLSIGGFINARHINVNTHNITIDKKSSTLSELNAVLIADTHMGYSIGCNQIKKMVAKINELNPDIVILAGDIFDNSFESLENPQEMAEIYRQIKSRYGVYATFGNHDVKADLVGGFTVSGSRMRDERMEHFLKDSNIHILQDDIVTIADDSIYLIGRLDGEETGNGKERKSLDELTNNLDPDKPLFIINHEPVELQNYANHHVDVLFSGHTHDGQFFPLTIVNPFVWKNAHGCCKIDNMYSLVTSGIGVYGPYMRIFTEAEILQVHISLQ